MLRIFDVLGREVRVLVDADRSAGVYTHHFDAGHLAGGVYVFRLETVGQIGTRRMIVRR